MELRIHGLLAAGNGLVTATQLLDAGVHPTTIRHLVRTGELVTVRRGVYAEGEAWRMLDEYRGRPRLRTRAAVAVMRRNFVISHDSAAHEHGLEILNPPDPHVHITRAGHTGAWTKAGVKHHLAAYTKEQVVTIEDLRVLDIPRTVVDIAREHGEPYGEVAADAALRHGVPRSALMAAYEPMRCWKHVTRTRRAVDFADAGAESALETLGRLLVTALGLDEEIDTQFPVRLPGGRLVWGDIRVGCHLFECDGAVKYESAADGGVATPPVKQVVMREKRRERELANEGLGISRIFWEDYWSPYRYQALARMRAEYAHTVSRFGTNLPERLARNAAMIRADLLRGA